MKGYLSVREISYKWNVSERWVSKLAQDGRIPGMERFGWSWAIPEDAEQPADPRQEKIRKTNERRETCHGKRRTA